MLQVNAQGKKKSFVLHIAKQEQKHAETLEFSYKYE